RIRPREVCRRQGVDQVIDDESKLLCVLPIEFGILDQAARLIGDRQVALGQAPEDPVLRPRRITEPAVALWRRPVRRSDGGPREPDRQARRPPSDARWPAGEPEQQPGGLRPRQQPATPDLRKQLIEAHIVAADRGRGWLTASVHLRLAGT